MTLEYWLSRKLFHLATWNTMYKPPLIRYNIVVFHPRTLVGVLYLSFKPNRKYSQILYLAGEKCGLVCCFSMDLLLSVMLRILCVYSRGCACSGIWKDTETYLNLRYTWVERALTKFMLTCIYCHRFRHFVQKKRMID